MKTNNAWFTTELSYLRGNYGTIRIRSMEYLLRRHTYSAIKQKARSIGLSPARAARNVEMK